MAGAASACCAVHALGLFSDNFIMSEGLVSCRPHSWLGLSTAVSSHRA